MTKKTTKKSAEPTLADFEKQLKNLEDIVERMEKGEQNLEQALDDFESGIRLTNDCQTMLKQAEQRIEQLVKKDGELVLEPFNLETAVERPVE